MNSPTAKVPISKEKQENISIIHSKSPVKTMDAKYSKIPDIRSISRTTLGKKPSITTDSTGNGLKDNLSPSKILGSESKVTAKDTTSLPTRSTSESKLIKSGTPTSRTGTIDSKAAKETTPTTRVRSSTIGSGIKRESLSATTKTRGNIGGQSPGTSSSTHTAAVTPKAVVRPVTTPKVTPGISTPGSMGSSQGPRVVTRNSPGIQSSAKRAFNDIKNESTDTAIRSVSPSKDHKSLHTAQTAEQQQAQQELPEVKSNAVLQHVEDQVSLSHELPTQEAIESQDEIHPHHIEITTLSRDEIEREVKEIITKEMMEREGKLLDSMKELESQNSDIMNMLRDALATVESLNVKLLEERQEKALVSAQLHDLEQLALVDYLHKHKDEVIVKRSKLILFQEIVREARSHIRDVAVDCSEQLVSTEECMSGIDFNDVTEYYENSKKDEIYKSNKGWVARNESNTGASQAQESLFEKASDRYPVEYDIIDEDEEENELEDEDYHHNLGAEEYIRENDIGNEEIEVVDVEEEEEEDEGEQKKHTDEKTELSETVDLNSIDKSDIDPSIEVTMNISEIEGNASYEHIPSEVSKMSEGSEGFYKAEMIPEGSEFNCPNDSNNSEHIDNDEANNEYPNNTYEIIEESY